MTTIPLPPPEMRVGTKERRNDAAYLGSAIEHADFLAEHCDVTSASRILDIGCGQARLLYGLNERFGGVARYVGLDVASKSIDWLNEHVAPSAPYAEFIWLDYRNERYHPNGREAISWSPDHPFDCATLFSVFSHMRAHDVEAYMALLSRAVRPSGFVTLTAFAEDDVPDEEENPADYLMEWKGPLHCVRFNRRYLDTCFEQHGFAISSFDHRAHTVGQSVYVLRRDQAD